MRVIVAHKDPYDLEWVAAELRQPGVEVIEAGDGREVLRLAAEHRPDVVVMNSSLSQMGGFAVARDLKMFADMPGAAPAPRVVVILERDADAWLAEWARCDAWKTWPLSPQELRTMTGLPEPSGVSP